jgi:hypothetical protein
MSRGRLIAVAIVLISVTVTVALLAKAQSDDGFPHDRHTGLFPLCIGCHEGIPEGNLAEFYPSPETCVGCHDGQRERRVDWTGPTRRITNLDFDHPTHQAETLSHDGRELDCSACHIRPGTRRMDVEYAVVEQCLACHAHQARDHYVDADCATCHLPLAETRFTAMRVSGLPRPPSHDLPHFLTDVHGSLARTQTARCATCHTRELCASCHVDVPRITEIGRIPAAGPALGLPRFTAQYPVPLSHLQPGWEENHGAAASVQSCSTCHTRESCTACHTQRVPRAVAQLPSRENVAAPGAQVAMRAPESHASAFFAARHGAIAAARPQNCAACHSQSRFCQACHEPLAHAEPSTAPPDSGSGGRWSDLLDAVKRFRPTGGSKASIGWSPSPRTTKQQGEVVVLASLFPLPSSLVGRNGAAVTADTLPRRLPVQVVRDTVARPATQPRPTRRFTRAPEFHPSNYLSRHAAEAYAQRQECSSCHNTRVFCRDCHQQAGFEATGRLGPGFHSAEPVWLFRHSQAARQTLESCASCHAQRDCMQCHSQLGSFQVSPHGRNFDAERARRRNPQICGACHLAGSTGGRTP